MKGVSRARIWATRSALSTPEEEEVSAVTTRRMAGVTRRTTVSTRAALPSAEPLSDAVEVVWVRRRALKPPAPTAAEEDAPPLAPPLTLVVVVVVVWVRRAPPTPPSTLPAAEMPEALLLLSLELAALVTVVV